MPAYRSSAEGEIRVAVVERLREMMPGCRIIHEINAASFGNRIDVLAVGEKSLAAVEIKSAKDKLDRLPDQIKAMSLVTPHVYAALHEKFLEGGPLGSYPPKQARDAIAWVFPRVERKGHVECSNYWRGRDAWRKPIATLPPGALLMLWREELQAICSGLGVKGYSKFTMEEAADHIRWRMTGEQIAVAVCNVLRARRCVEADPEIFASVAA
ncbi:NERD domain-containing protein [Agrobacterium sp. MCAB5]|uniref:NERD domain-containing protein n=1 Tax=Agrobacterium sp. MCAB5 TaxID=3233042 RepID=UPI003F8E76EE